MKPRTTIKWVAIFLILTLWTAVVITGVPVGKIQSVEAASADNSGPIYIMNGFSFDELEKMDLLNYLFTNDFTLEVKTELTPSNKFSLRGHADATQIDGQWRGSDANINLNILDRNNNAAHGSITVQRNDGQRLSLSLDDLAIVENTPHHLELEGMAEGRWNRNPVSSDVMIHFNKDTFDLEVTGDDLDFFIDFDEVTCTHCQNTLQTFTLLTPGDDVSIRSIGEVRTLLEDNPVIIDEFASLNVLNTPAWATLAPHVS